MRNTWTIAKKEYQQYFTSPAAYMIAFMILLVIGIIFYATIVSAMVQQTPPGIQIILGPLVTLLIFASPAITMRLVAEEQRTGTIELLLTAPVKDWELITGKWLGGYLFTLTLLSVTMIYPLFLNQMIDPGIDQGLFLAGYLGLMLVSAATVAIGTMISSLFSNQIAAFFATFGVLLVLWIIGFPAQAHGATASLLNYLDFSGHFYETFFRGLIDLTDIVYFASITFLFLLLGSLSVETRRWR